MHTYTCTPSIDSSYFGTSEIIISRILSPHKHTAKGRRAHEVTTQQSKIQATSLIILRRISCLKITQSLVLVNAFDKTNRKRWLVYFLRKHSEDMMIYDYYHMARRAPNHHTILDN